MFGISFTRPLATLGAIAFVAAGIVTDNKDPDKLRAVHASVPSGAIVAADFEYKEARGSTAVMRSSSA